MATPSDGQRILMTAQTDPFGRSHGATLRLRAIVDGLRSIGTVEIAIVGGKPLTISTESWPADVRCVAEVFAPMNRSGAPVALEAILTGRPRKLYWRRRRLVARGLKDAGIEPGAYDVVWVSREVTLGLVRSSVGDTPTVVDVDDAQVRRPKLDPVGARSVVSNQLLRIDRRGWRIEQNRRVRSGTVAVISDRHDTAVVSPPHVLVPNPVPMATTPPPRPEGCHCVFIGSMTYPPNADGLRWLTSEIWPRVRRVLPESTLDVIGRLAPEQRRLADPSSGITLHGAVDDVLPFIESATTVLVPLRRGLGTSIKTLEGLASGRPVVTTSTGIRGIAGPDSIALIADTPEGFCDAIVTASTSPMDAMINRASEYVARHHSRSVIHAAVHEAVSLAQRSSGS